MSRPAIVMLVATLTIIIVGSTGCMKCGRSLPEKAMESAIEKAVEKGTGGKVNIDAGSNVDISDLPDFLRYPGAKPTARWSMTNDKGSGVVFVLESPDARNTIAAHYKQAMSGWKSSATTETDDAISFIYTNETEKQFVSVLITNKDGGGSTITITHTKE